MRERVKIINGMELGNINIMKVAPIIQGYGI